MASARRLPNPSEPWMRYAEAARAAGVPRDQLENFIRGGYIAQRHQLPLHAVARQADAPDGPSMIAFGGRRGPGKTHATFAQVALDDCQRCTGVKFLFLRKVLKAARESFEDIRRKILVTTPHDYRSQAGIVEFANSSRILLGHFSKESDIDQYLGIEYDGVAIEEMTLLSRAKIEMLRGSVRSTIPGWRPRVYATTNPGGIGHSYFRSTFVLPWREGRERETRFLPAMADDNRYLDAGYRRWLQNLSGTLGRMWRDGDWDVAGGAFFTNWSYERVVIPPLAVVPPSWRVWLAMDYGFQHPCVIHLIAEDDQGRVTFVDEHHAQRWLVDQHAAALRDMLARNGIDRRRISAFVAGHDCFARERDGKTVADDWQQAGWTLTRAVVNRRQGAREWLQRLGNPEAGVPTTVRISTRCGLLIATIPMMLGDPRDPEDVLKVDCDEDGEGGDDAYDCGRYGLMLRQTSLGITLPDPVPGRWRPLG